MDLPASSKPSPHPTAYGVCAALVLAAALWAYWPAMRGPFIGDDREFFAQASALRDANGLWKIWFDPRATTQYYPLVFTSFWMEGHFWGMNTTGYHATNLALHLANGLLVWRLLAMLGVPAAGLAAALFALHPVQTESVAWIIERKNVLSAFFYLLSMTAFLRSRGVPSPPRRARAWYGLALGLFVAALLSKSVTATLPAAALVILRWRNGRLSRGDWLSAAPFLLIALPMVMVTIWMEQHQSGAKYFASGLSPLDRLLLAAQASWFYLGRLVVPASLSFVYPRWTIDPHQIGSYIAPAAIVMTLTAAFLGRRLIGRGPLACFLLFGGTLLPALGVVDFYYMRYSFVADRFVYLACIAPLALIGCALSAITARAIAPVRAVMVAALLCVLTVLTHQRAALFGEPERLWADAIEKNPSAWLAHNNLGRLLADRGQWDEARSHYESALKYNPDHADAHSNLAVVLARRGAIDGAVGHLRAALALLPDFPEANNNLANILLHQGRPAEALERYDRVLRGNPRWGLAHCNRGLALMALGRVAEADAAFREALRLDPALPVAHRSLGAMALQKGDVPAALAELRESAAQRPDDPKTRLLLGRALAAAGRVDEAIREFDTVLRLEPGNAEAHRARAEALAPLHRPGDTARP